MWDEFKSWASKPFRADMGIGGWFLFLGLLIVLTALWGLILKHVTEGIE